MTYSMDNSRKRLAIVVTARITATSFVSGFAKYVAAKGLHVTVIADGVKSGTYKIGGGVLTFIPVSMSRNPDLQKDLVSLVRLIRLLSRVKPDILTYATPKASLLSSISGVLLRIPVRAYQLWGLRMETTDGLMRKFLMLMEMLTSALSTKVLANSPSLADRYQELGLSVGKKIDVLGHGSSHGVDLSYFSLESTFPLLDEATASCIGDRQSDFVVGFVGRLHPDKGIDTLLNAIGLVREAGFSVKLVLVGNNEGADILAHAALQQDAIIVGHVSDTRPYYNAMDVLVLPSLREGFPNVVLEASAMSVPAIVSTGTGVVDSVVDRKTGIIVPVGDPVALADAVLLLAKNPKLRARMGMAARSLSLIHI